MTKKDLIASLQKDASLTKSTALAAVNAMFEIIRRDLAESSAFRMDGIGTLQVVNREPRKGRNPQTGKEITIPARKVVKFTVSKKLRDSLN